MKNEFPIIEFGMSQVEPFGTREEIDVELNELKKLKELQSIPIPRNELRSVPIVFTEYPDAIRPKIKKLEMSSIEWQSISESKRPVKRQLKMG